MNTRFLTLLLDISQDRHNKNISTITAKWEIYWYLQQRRTCKGPCHVMSCHVNVSFCDENEMASNSEIQIVRPTTTSPSVQIIFPQKVRSVFVVDSGEWPDVLLADAVMFVMFVMINDEYCLIHVTSTVPAKQWMWWWRLAVPMVEPDPVMTDENNRENKKYN